MSLSNSEQIVKIKEILGDQTTEVPQYRFKWGKYQNKTLAYVLEHDKRYLFWLYNNAPNLPKKLEKIIEQIMQDNRYQ